MPTSVGWDGKPHWNYAGCFNPLSIPSATDDVPGDDVDEDQKTVRLEPAPLFSQCPRPPLIIARVPLFSINTPQPSSSTVLNPTDPAPPYPTPVSLHPPPTASYFDPAPAAPHTFQQAQ